MGETRAKKPSKRTLKAQTDAEASLSTNTHNLKIPDLKMESLSSSPAASISFGSYGSSAPSTKPSNEDMRSMGVINPDTEDSHVPLIEIRPTLQKGLAVFATQKIAAGTLVLTEAPLIRLTREQEELGTADDVLESAYADLNKPERQNYLALFDSKKARFSRVKSIYYSNCYNLAIRSNLGGSCIGLIASRINHSCIPNVQVSYDDKSGQLLFYATRSIPRNKEICSNYNTVFDARDHRQTKQMLYYGFHCDCEACEQQTDFWARSDERRQEMIRARKSVRESEVQWTEGRLGKDQVHEVIVRLEKLESAMTKEGLSGDVLANVYRGLAKWAERAEDATALKKWQQMELKTCIICLGEQSSRAKEIAAKLIESS